MTFYPAIPFGGYLGWQVFDRIAPRQRETFENQPSIRRDVEHFKENVRMALSPDDLVRDRRLLTVALGAFGLEGEIDKKALIRRVLEEGTENRDAFANKLSDPRWREFANAFSYGNLGGSSVLLSGFRNDIAERFLERAFEARVGDVDPEMRLALNFRREAARIAANPDADRTGWFQMMGQRPLRTVMEDALGLPQSIGTVDIDRQKETFESRFRTVFGVASLTALSDAETMDAVLRRFFLQSEIRRGPAAATPGMAALSVLSAGSGPADRSALFSTLV